MTQQIFALIAVALSIGGHAPYVYDTLRGRTRPHMYTWLVGTVVDLTIAGAMIVKLAGPASWPTLVNATLTALIFVLSFRYGYKKITLFDTFCLLLALCGVGVWFATDDPTLAVVIAVITDVVSFIPTYRKTFKSPYTETQSLYAISGVRHALTLFAISTVSIATALHSAVMIIHNICMVTMITIKRRKKARYPSFFE